MVVDATPAVFMNLNVRASQIAVGEVFAVLLLFYSFGHVLSGNAANVYIDNAGVLYAIVNGVAKHTDLGTTIHGLHLRLNSLHAACWFEHVASWSNIADGGSRVGVSDVTAANFGIVLEQVDMPALPRNFPRCIVQDWTDFWRTGL